MTNQKKIFSVRFQGRSVSPVLSEKAHPESIKVWEKEIKRKILHKSEPPDKFADFKIHDVQMKDDQTAILFSKRKVVIETIAPDQNGIRKVILSKSFPPTQSGTNPSTIVKGKLVWLYDELHIIMRTMMRGTEFWMLKGGKLIKVSDARIY